MFVFSNILAQDNKKNLSDSTTKFQKQQSF